MTEKKTAYEVIKETYNIETLREIVDHGCVSAAAEHHVYYQDTIPFFE